MKPVLPRDSALVAGTSVLAIDGGADIDAETRDSDGAAEAGLAEEEAELLGPAETAVVGGAVVLRGGVELPTVMSEFPLLWYPSVARIMYLKLPRFIP